MSGTLTARISAAREAGDPNAMAEAIPYARFLDITAALDGDDLVACMNFNQRIIGNPLLPAIHGGTIGGLLETTAILKLLWMQETVRIPKTITITVDYLRSAGAKDTYARANVTKLGARVANVKVFAWQDDPARPVAGANANFMLSPA